MVGVKTPVASRRLRGVHLNEVTGVFFVRNVLKHSSVVLLLLVLLLLLLLLLAAPAAKVAAAVLALVTARLTSHNRTEWSIEPEANRLPSPLK